MKVVFIFIGIYIQIIGNHSFIVPDELPSILSVIYSNIPTIKKGTDSRLGWGFRLGDRADFQVLVELGPQTNTQPLANQEDKSSNKRNTINNLSNVLYAQRQQEKKQEQLSNSEGGKWLSEWSKSVKQNRENEALPAEPRPRPGLGIGEIDAKSVIPDDSVLELEELYKKQKQNSGPQKIRIKTKKEETKISTEKPNTTTSKKDALDNVNLDD